MRSLIKRRGFIKNFMGIPVVATTPLFSLFDRHEGENKDENKLEAKLRISLNAYSFNEPLRSGKMTLDDLLVFCAFNNFDAVDLTGYYFPGYPAVPQNDYVFHLKQRAHKMGLDISGTGVKNDFTVTDVNKRKDDISLVKKWIEVAARLGAPVIRIFSGLNIPTGYSWEQVAEWVAKDIRECVAYGKEHGVMVAMQNHDDFIKTADQAEKIISMVGSDWFGLVLDIGSYRTGDPYAQIAQTAKYALNWQLKELMFIDGNEQKTDLRKVIRIIEQSGYRGYLPIETLGPGDPKQKIPLFLTQVRNALKNYEA